MSMFGKAKDNYELVKKAREIQKKLKAQTVEAESGAVKVIMTGEQRYISNELTHLVGRGLKSYEGQYNILIKILKEGYITYPPHEKKERNARCLSTYYTTAKPKNYDH